MKLVSDTYCDGLLSPAMRGQQGKKTQAKFGDPLMACHGATQNNCPGLFNGRERKSQLTNICPHCFVFYFGRKYAVVWKPQVR